MPLYTQLHPSSHGYTSFFYMHFSSIHASYFHGSLTIVPSGAPHERLICLVGRPAAHQLSAVPIHGSSQQRANINDCFHIAYTPKKNHTMWYIFILTVKVSWLSVKFLSYNILYEFDEV